MINLIPPTAKKQVRREYWVRVVSVYLMLWASACVMVVLLFIPAYVLIQSQLSAYANKIDQANVQNVSYKQSVATVQQANEVVTLLASDQDATPFTQLLQQIESYAGTHVTLNSVSFERNSDGIGTINVSGVATNRQSLVTFSDALKGSDSFESADIPISNLAKDRDIPFSIKVVPKKGLK